MERFYKISIYPTPSSASVTVDLQTRSLSSDWCSMLKTTCDGFTRAQEIAQEWRINKCNCTDYCFELTVDTTTSKAS
jgi:hypothetical protein